MRTEVFWIDGPWAGRLSVSPRPRGGDWLPDEVAAWRRAGIQSVVSLLTEDEAAELDLVSEPEECEAVGIEFVAFPVIDRGVPASVSAYGELVEGLARQLADGRTILVHCRQGIGRAALIGIGVLVAAGVEPTAAVERVEKARGRPVPETAEQRRWIEEYARMLSHVA